MNKALGSRIDWTQLEEGKTYRIKIRSLGEVMGKLLNKQALTFEIVEGRLQSQADKKKQWRVGDTFETIPGMFDAWECQ